jgi:monoamine oxidase
MARTPLAQTVEEAFGRIVDEELRATRRSLLKGAGAAVLGASMLGRFAAPARAAGATRVVVIGAGLAGLTSAYRLRQQGIVAQVYEAADRIGGRCWSGSFPNGQGYEHGGELIDNGHIATKRLAQELGLNLDNLLQAETAGTEMLGYFHGTPYTYAQMSADLNAIWQQLHKDTSAASYPTLYNLYTPRGYELDHMSIAQWIDNYVPGGHASQLGELLDVAYNIEYGADCTVQSALNMLYLLGYVGQGQFRVFGKSNEKFHVRGGNDQLVSGLQRLLSGQISTGTALTAIKHNADGTYALTLQSGVSSRTVIADHVVLALPFTLLRAVDRKRAGFNAIKTIAIEESSMGTNSKLHLQFKSRFWRDQGCNGETYSDTGYQNTWEVTRAQVGTTGILVNYTGGAIGAAVGSGTPADQAAKFLGQVQPVLPGAKDQWNGQVARDFWTDYQWTKGSYSYWKVGQYTRFSGAEKERSGNCHFAGEHTSQDFQGYLNGAVETGERAASEVLADLK